MIKKISHFLMLLLSLCLLLVFVSCNKDNTSDVGGNDDNETPPSEITVISEGDCGENIKWVLKSNGILTISGSGDMSNYSYDILSGETEKSPWDTDKLKIKKVVVEEGVKSIGDYSFYSCSNLTDVSLPRGVVKIGTYAFGFTGIENISLPYTLTTICDGAFSTDSLKEAHIPYNVRELGKNAFLSDNLISYTVAENSNYFSAKDGVLYNYLGTKLIAYPAAKSETTYIMPEEVTSIAFNAFFECDNLTNIVISPNLREVEAGAFRCCGNITSLSIPNGVQELGSDTFDGCTNLSSITIGAGVSYLSGTTFRSCNLTEVNISADNPYYMSIDGVVFSKDGKTIVYYPCSRANTQYSIPFGVTKIGAGCFSTADYLTKINIPESVVEIGYCAFEWTNIQSIYIPKSVKKINFSAFSECDNLTTVYYGGTASDWIEIEIGNWNSILLKAERIYNSSAN